DEVRGRHLLDGDGVGIGDAGDWSLRDTVNLHSERSVDGVPGSVHVVGRISFGAVLDLDGDGAAFRRGAGAEFGLLQVELPGSVARVVGSARRGYCDSGEQKQGCERRGHYI